MTERTAYQRKQAPASERGARITRFVSALQRDASAHGDHFGVAFWTRPLPLQCALYAQVGRIPDAHLPPKGGYVVIDSIRQIQLVEALRSQHRTLCIIVDMDDLMSRRVRLHLEHGHGVALGAFAEKLPRIFVRLLTGR